MKTLFKSVLGLLGISFNFIYRDDSSELVSREFKNILDNPDDKRKYVDAISHRNSDDEIVLHNGNKLSITQ